MSVSMFAQFVKGRRRKMKQEQKQQQADEPEDKNNVTEKKDDASSSANASGGAVSKGGDPEDSGFELQRSLMDEAMDNVVVTTATRQDDIHPNQKDVKMDKVSISLFGKELLKECDINLHWGQR